MNDEKMMNETYALPFFVVKLTNRQQKKIVKHFRAIET
jgi:hypothetical protein